MTLPGIAYGPDEHVLLTFDGGEVLAHDAQTEAPKWRLAVEQPVVALSFADPSALPGSQGGSPWRSGAGRTVVAVDAAGGVHTIDPAAGQETSKHGPFGKPLAFAAGVAGAGALLALATEDRLFLWRGGERTEIPGRASAIAFSNDGATLAIGGTDGSLRFLSIHTGNPVETFCAVVHGGITDLVQHPGGVWIAAGKSGISTVTGDGPQRLTNLPADVSRLRLDATGRRLSAQLGDRTVAVYAWPSLELVTRIEYVERSVRGLSFGPGDWLGIALDHGDGNKIDVVTSATHRTDTHPGRTHRSWILSVRGKESMLSAKEAEDSWRMKDPFHVPAPQKAPGGDGARVGIGAGLSILLLFVRLCAVGSRHSSTYPTYPAYTPPAYDPLTAPSTGGAGTCDRACAKQRLEFVREQCPPTNALCRANATVALAALATGDCARAKTSLARIGVWPSSGDSSRDLLGRAGLSIAVRGLAEACSSGSGSGGGFAAGPTRHASLVRLHGATLQANTEEIPASSLSESELPGAIWAAPDGTVFVSTKAGAGSSNVHRRDKSGAWSIIARRRSTQVVQIWGRSATDLTLMDVDSLAHYDGTKTTEITPPAPRLTGLGGIGDDIFVMGESAAASELQRRRGVAGTWALEAVGVDGVTPRKLFAGNGTLWATGADSDDSDADADHLLVRAGNGKWAEKKWYGTTKPPSSVIRAVWVSPSNDAFVATDSGIYRSTGGGATWTKSGPQTDVESLWGRSNGDVYATSDSGLLHFDGKAWTATKYTGTETVIGGTATEVLLMGTSTDD
ncbi:hypothetical protein BH11MYX4_BH11MYX4_30360 [soil metagenome]